jgi:hypothetical protein
MRERMCSAWTVTLHFQALVSLASVLRAIGRTQEADRFVSLSAVQSSHNVFIRMIGADVDNGESRFSCAGGRRTDGSTSLKRRTRWFCLPSPISAISGKPGLVSTVTTSCRKSSSG